MVKRLIYALLFLYYFIPPGALGSLPPPEEPEFAPLQATPCSAQELAERLEILNSSVVRDLNFDRLALLNHALAQRQAILRPTRPLPGTYTALWTPTEAPTA